MRTVRGLQGNFQSHAPAMGEHAQNVEGPASSWPLSALVAHAIDENATDATAARPSRGHWTSGCQIWRATFRPWGSTRRTWRATLRRGRAPRGQSA